MLKTGITSVDQLRQRPSGNTRLIDVSLLLELLPSVDGDETASLRQEIVRNMILPNSTGKTTWKSRFPGIDESVADILKQHFTDRLDCLDLGVSDGTTAVDMFGQLRDIAGLSYTASDINENVHIRKGRVWTDVCDDDGKLLQSSIGPFVIPTTGLFHMHRLQLVNRALYLWIRLFRQQQVHRSWCRDQATAGADRRFATVSLQSSEFANLAGSDARLRFRRINLFDPPADTFDFVRIMNVLNRQTDGFGFSDTDLVRGCTGILNMLAQDGFFLVGRTVRGESGFQSHATLFHRQGNELAECHRFGEGTEILDHVRQAWQTIRERNHAS